MTPSTLTDRAVIEADYPTLLTQLLHYPAPSPTYPFDPSLILSQAIFLKGNISPASGVEIVLQNQDILGIKAQPPERDRSEEPERIRGQRAPRGRPSQGPGQAQQRGVQGFAQGWIDRAQAAGLDKAVLSAVSDLRVCPSPNAIDVG
jgi:TBC1 domain family protein 5